LIATGRTTRRNPRRPSAGNLGRLESTMAVINAASVFEAKRARDEERVAAALAELRGESEERANAQRAWDLLASIAKAVMLGLAIWVALVVVFLAVIAAGARVAARGPFRSGANECIYEAFDKRGGQ
jgi:hypothetical protein